MPCGSEIEPNSTPAKATAFSRACAATKTGHITTATDVDYYTVTPDGTGNDLQVQLDVPTGKDYDLAVTTPDAKTTTAREGNGTPETLRLPTTKGATLPYTIRIRGAAGSYSPTKPYTLTVKHVEPAKDENGSEAG